MSSIKQIAETTGLVPIVQQPTRKGNILDQILISQPCYHHVQVITSSVKSDHKAIIARHNHKPIPPGILPDKICKYRRRTPSQNAEFLSFLSKQDITLTTEQGSGSVQEDFDQFYRTTVEILDRFYPEKEIKLPPGIQTIWRRLSNLSYERKTNSCIRGESRKPINWRNASE